MGNRKRCSKKSSTVSPPDTRTRKKSRYDNGGMVKILGTKQTKSKHPNRTITRPELEYMRLLELESAYIASQRRDETMKTYRKMTYHTMELLTRDTHEFIELRIKNTWPNHDWDAIWENLHNAPISDSDKGEWYRVIHDLIPTNERTSHQDTPSSNGKMQSMPQKIHHPT
jgi:hypothetical protein